MKSFRFGVAALAVVACLVASGCGVGGEGTGSSPPSYAAGPVEGFGSVIVAGRRFDDRDARVLLQIDPRAPQQRPLADLKLGVLVQLRADAQDRLDEVVIAPEVVGPVAEVDAAQRRFVVAAQTIQVDTVAADPTLFEGARGIADLRPGNAVIVHGRRDANGLVRATRVVRLGTPAGVRVMGTLEQLSAGAAVVSGLNVDLRDAGALAGNDSLRLGDRVFVFGDSLAGSGTLHALATGRDVARVGDAVQAALAGIVTRFEAPARWQLQGVSVDAGSLSAAELAGVADGRLVQVSGALEGGVLKAQAVRVQADVQAPRVTIDATVSDFVDARSFSLRGTPIDASAARFEGLTAGNLANGVPLQITATVSGNAVIASDVRASLPPAGTVFVQAGALTDWDGASQRLRLFGLAPDFQLTASTRFAGGTEADLVAGAIVEVRGTQTGSTFTVQALTFAAADTVIGVAGVAATVESAGDTGFLQVNEVDITWDAATVFRGATGTPADLIEGRAVRVRGARDPADPNALRAIEIDARESQPGVFRLRGTVSDYVSLGDFRIDGQRIDARGAVFEPAGLANALAGAYVDVEGTLDGSVLRATVVSDP